MYLLSAPWEGWVGTCLLKLSCTYIILYYATAYVQFLNSIYPDANDYMDVANWEPCYDCYYKILVFQYEFRCLIV